MISEQERTCEICGKREYAFILEISPKGICQDCCVVPDYIPDAQFNIFLEKKKLKVKKEV